jgi:hypothetical protein
LYTWTRKYKEKFFDEMAQIIEELDLKNKAKELKNYKTDKMDIEDKREEGGSGEIFLELAISDY